MPLIFVHAMAMPGYYIRPTSALVYSDDATARRSLYRAYCCPMYVEEVMAHGCAVCVCNEERRTMEERAFVGRRPDERARRSVVLSASLRKRVNFAHPHTPPDSASYTSLLLAATDRAQAGPQKPHFAPSLGRPSLCIHGNEKLGELVCFL